ncbi:MAG: hypothetical protein ACR2RV_27970 [Verrucomicrobiales bacterium]
MKPPLLALFALLCLLVPATGADQVRSLLALQVEQEKAMLALQEGHAERIGNLQKSYVGALKKLQQATQQGGNLDGALAVEKELASQMESPLSQGEIDALQPEVATLRAKYDSALLKHSATKHDLEIQQLEAFNEQLLALQAGLTKAGELETAVEVRDLQQANAKQLEALRPARPAGAADPGNPPVARPEPGPGAGAADTASAGKLTKVADAVKGKGGVEGAAPSVIAFDGPSGDGRRGAKGILVKADSDGSGSGSTWAMDYSRARSARGLQIIHPRGSGHAIVHIIRSGVGISTPGEWRNVGYVGGGGTSVRKKRAFDEVFPLVDEQTYAIVSRMAKNGSCEVFVDGKLVATANVKSAKPLSLAIPEGEKFPRSSTWDKLAFKGDGLPMQWERNWAGVIVEPLDSGSNLCRNLRYCHGLAELPAAE